MPLAWRRDAESVVWRAVSPCEAQGEASASPTIGSIRATPRGMGVVRATPERATAYRRAIGGANGIPRSGSGYYRIRPESLIAQGLDRSLDEGRVDDVLERDGGPDEAV